MKDVVKKYDNGTTALRGVTVQIEPGEFAYIVGPSGAGKSTFIRLLYREVKHDKGSLIVADFDLDKIVENFKAFMDQIIRLKPASSKGQYLRTIAVSLTMGPGVKMDPAIVAKIVG